MTRADLKALLQGEGWLALGRKVCQPPEARTPKGKEKEVRLLPLRGRVVALSFC